MTQAQILSEFQQLTTPQQLDLLQAALDLLRQRLRSPQAESVPSRQPMLSEAAQQLLNDYQSDDDLTSFTALDGEPVHATR